MIPVILRRADMRRSDAAVVRAVSARWAATGCGSSLRSIVEDVAPLLVAGERLTKTMVRFRLDGLSYKTGRPPTKVPGKLEDRGFVARPLCEGGAHTRVPGSRLAGLDSDGWPLEFVILTAEFAPKVTAEEAFAHA